MTTLIFKKTKATCLFMLLSISGMAVAQVYTPLPELPPPPVEVKKTPTKNGVYFGLGAGGISLHNKMSTEGEISFANDLGTQLIDSTANSGNVGLNGVTFLGYSLKTPNRFFMGVEGFYDLMNVSANTTTATTSVIGDTTLVTSSEPDMKLKYSYGIRALPGYQATETAVVYGILGYSYAHASTDITASGSASNTLTEKSGADSVSTSDTFNFGGYQLGLGSMINVASHLALRGDLIYTGYSKETLQSGSKSSSNGTASASVSSEPSTLEADVALVLTFD